VAPEYHEITARIPRPRRLFLFHELANQINDAAQENAKLNEIRPAHHMHHPLLSLGAKEISAPKSREPPPTVFWQRRGLEYHIFVLFTILSLQFRFIRQKIGRSQHKSAEIARFYFLLY
jgi:hypothetical protein